VKHRITKATIEHPEEEGNPRNSPEVGAPEDKRHHYRGCSAVNSPQSQGGRPEVVEARGQPRLPPSTRNGRPQPNSSSLTRALTSRSRFDWWPCIIAVFGFRTTQ
jgi:hypothetical protein